MKLCMAQTNPVIGDFTGNTDMIIRMASQAKARGCDLVIFPELAVSGYPPGDFLEKPDFIGAQLKALDRLVADIQGIGVLVGYADPHPSSRSPRLKNAALLFENGARLGRIAKQLLPTYDIFDESRYFVPGEATAPIFYKGLRLGITICEDVWNDDLSMAQADYETNPVADLAAQGVDLLVNIAASPFNAGKPGLRETMLKRISMRHSSPLVFVNQAGGMDSILFDGLSCAFDSRGKPVARATDFSEDLVVLDTRTMMGDTHESSGSEMEILLKALVTGTRDYVCKSGFSKAVIGLSGGIDSALTAAIAAMALGSSNVQALFMPSLYTSETNTSDTRTLAGNLNIAWREIPITPMYTQFLSTVPNADIDNPGITEQNLQARIRGTLLMAVTNQEGSILLATGNKSEMAVGYSTLYGDMCGGLAVIGDLPKRTVYDLARFINRERPVIPESIIAKAPSAELAPNQTDQDDLPPYDTIDAVVTGYVEQHRSVQDLVESGFDETHVREVINRINRNEYKRFQAPPILRVTSKAFGPGRRYPMVHRVRA